MLLIFTKNRLFKCREADLLSVFILSDFMLLGVGVRKEQYIRNVWSWGWNVGHYAHSCRPLDGNKQFSKKTMKRVLNEVQEST